MRPIVTDGVAWSVGLSRLSALQKTAEPIEVPFWIWNRVGSRNHVLDGVHIGVA